MMRSFPYRSANKTTRKSRTTRGGASGRPRVAREGAGRRRVSIVTMWRNPRRSMLRAVTSHVVAAEDAAAAERGSDKMAPPAPQRVPVDDTAGVAAALKRDGAVILTDLGPIEDWEKAATDLPARVFSKPGKLISKEPVVAGIHQENRRFTELRKQRQRAMGRAVSPMERRPIGLNGDPDEPVWGGLGGLTHENQRR